MAIAMNEDPSSQGAITTYRLHEGIPKCVLGLFGYLLISINHLIP